MHEKTICTTKNIRRDGKACLQKKLAKSKEIVTKKSGNQYSTNNSLAHSKERLDSETPQATTRSGHIGRGQAKHKQFCVDMQEKHEEYESIKRPVFSDDATFHTNGKVNKHNARILCEENPHSTVEHVRDSPKVSVFCAITKKQVYGKVFL